MHLGLVGVVAAARTLAVRRNPHSLADSGRNYTQRGIVAPGPGPGYIAGAAVDAENAENDEKAQVASGQMN